METPQQTQRTEVAPKWLGSWSVCPAAWVAGPTTTTPSAGPAQLTAPLCIPVCTEEADEVSIGRNLQDIANVDKHLLWVFISILAAGGKHLF